MDRQEYKKNQLIEFDIIDYTHDGQGIGKTDAFIWLIKDTVIGDRVKASVMKVKKNYGYARLVEIISKSDDRIESLCKVSRSCGGCNLQSMSYEAELKFKENKVINNLIRLGNFKKEDLLKDGVFSGIRGMEDETRYRNKSVFPVGKNKFGELIYGFYASNSHNIIEHEDCIIGIEENSKLVKEVLAFFKEYKLSTYDEKEKKGILRHVFIRKAFVTGEIMLCLILNSKTMPYKEEFIKSFSKFENIKSIVFNINLENTNVLLGEETKLIYGREYIYDYIEDIKYKISANSFYQVNPKQTRFIYNKVLEYANLDKQKVVWDLYCGIGTISLFLSKMAKQVYGIEVVERAIKDAKENAKINDINNVEFYVGRAEDILPKLYEEAEKEGNEEARKKINPDVVVVDPPRKGCDIITLDTILKMGSMKVVYVSCDSSTLARDLKYLCERGYSLEKFEVIDQFPRSVHVETIALIQRVKS